jgi:bla regulator protein blaR1
MLGVLDSLARIAAERMVNSVVAGTILAFLVWSLLGFLPRLNARTRVAVWFSVLLAIPSLSVAAMFVGNTSSSLASQSARIIIPETWALGIFVTWIFFAVLGLLRIAFGLWRIRCLRHACSAVNLAHLDPGVLATFQEFRPKRPVALLASESARVPMAIGFFQPAIIVPKWVLRELSAQEISAILIHEFAHLRRWDDWSNFFQKLVRALFFFHPSIWWVDRQLALDREIACDDAVLGATNRAHDYARCLVGLAEKSLLRRSLTLAQAAVHRAQHISVRISQILDASRPRATRISRIALAGVTALAAICLVALLQSPTLIAVSSATIATVVPAERLENTAALRANPYQGSTVVPVAMRARSNILSHSAARSTKAKVAVAHAKSRETIVSAKFAPALQPPTVVRAVLTLHQQTVIPVENIVFVVPDARRDASGRVVWTLSVWRLTVFHPLPAPVAETISNSI